jgi:hypothetical protein
MAKIIEELIVVKVSYLIKEGKNQETIFDTDVVEAITDTIQEIASSAKPGAIVEIEKE